MCKQFVHKYSFFISLNLSLAYSAIGQMKFSVSRPTLLSPLTQIKIEIIEIKCNAKNEFYVENIARLALEIERENHEWKIMLVFHKS